MSSVTEIAIAGGGLIGCSTALHLLAIDSTLKVTVVEPDSSYESGSSAKATGGVRQLFTEEENIALSQYTLEVIRDWDNFAAIDGRSPGALGWHPRGYLMVFRHAEADTGRRMLDHVSDAGARVRWLGASELQEQIPVMDCDDLAGGISSPNDGWLDAWSFLQGIRRKSASLGATFVDAKVTEFCHEGTHVNGVTLSNGHRLSTDAVVNAAGCWAPELAMQQIGRAHV